MLSNRGSWSRKRREAGTTYRPTIEALEDRTVPSGLLSRFWHPVATATQLEVLVPEQVYSGKQFSVVVKAEDASNHLASGYTGTVQLSLGTTDAGATLPGSYTFKTTDFGIHVFQVTLTATGSQTITAADTALSSTITGERHDHRQSATGGNSFQGDCAEQAAVGAPTYVTIVALDAANHVVTNFGDTVTLSAASSNLPASYGFTSQDHGSHTFKVTFQTAGSETVSAVDAANSAVTGQASLTVYAAGQVTHFAVISFGFAFVGVSAPVWVMALDAANKVVPTYTGTVTFASSDGNASLPTDYAFTAADKGKHMFTVTLTTAGQQTVTVTDSAISGSASVTRLFVVTKPAWKWWY